MKYLQKTFTCPTSVNLTQQQWDRAFLSVKEYEAKYRIFHQDRDFGDETEE